MPCDSHGMSRKLARPERFELPTPRFVVWGRSLKSLRFVAHLYRGLGSAWQLQCVGCDMNYLWYFVGLPLASLVCVGLRWACWYSPKLIKTIGCDLSCLRRCVALKAPSEL